MLKRFLSYQAVLRFLGVLLLAGSLLKAHELLTVPVANRDLWTWRPFLVFQVEIELALGIWFIRGGLRRCAWLTAWVCFAAFSLVTLYKGITGAASCGCFGRVHVNPWITLSVIDVPAVVVLTWLRPAHVWGWLTSYVRRTVRLCALTMKTWQRGSRASSCRIRRIVGTRLLEIFPVRRRWAMAGVTSVILATLPVLVLHVPAQATERYEVLEPDMWLGRELPVLDHIDIRESLRAGIWLIMFYHYDCPHCAGAIPAFERLSHEVRDSDGFMRLAYVAVPPFGEGPIGPDTLCELGKMAPTKEWFVETPVMVLSVDGQVLHVYHEKVPDLDTVFGHLAGN